MESTETSNIIAHRQDTRAAALEQWLRKSCALEFQQLLPMTNDASFRRYFRIHTSKGTFVAMDAPPPQENCQPFVAIAKAIKAAGLLAPSIFAADIEHGFLLLTDFGDITYLRGLTPTNADALYERALNALVQLQHLHQVPERPIPPFTADFMQQEWRWHKEWFLGKLLQLQPGASEKALDDCFALIVQSATEQPQVFMHRDYHSANLMVLPDNDVGILDFQDAFIGPITYDLVSLLRDCYIDWPNARVQHWALQYQQKVAALQHIEPAQFLRWFDLMGIERHLKALFTFARKHVRDKQSHYLAHVPRTLGYLLTVSAHYPELSPLHHYLRDAVEPAFMSMQR